MKSHFLFLACAALLLGTACSSEPKEAKPETLPTAVVAPEPPQPPPPPPPPPHLQACEGKAMKAACSFATPKGDNVHGTCMQGPQKASGPLECHPGKPKKK